MTATKTNQAQIARIVDASATSAAGAAKQIKITLVRSVFGRLRAHRACVRGLGLTRMHSSVQIAATPENMGMVNKIGFMLKVEEIS